VVPYRALTRNGEMPHSFAVAVPPQPEGGGTVLPGLAAADRFYRGTVFRVQYGRGTGLLRTGSGREIRFEVPYVEFLDGGRIFDLVEGLEVGYDVGWTSRGLRVTKIKIG
jgi:hypothetical protein